MFNLPAKYTQKIPNFEHIPLYSVIFDPTGAKNGAVSGTVVQIPPEVARLLVGWPELPEPVKAMIRAAVESQNAVVEKFPDVHLVA